MKKYDIQLIHHLMLAATAVLFGMTSSYQLLGKFPSISISWFLGYATFLAYRIAVWAPYIQIKPFRIGFHKKLHLLQIILFILPIICVLPFLPTYSYIGTLFVGLFTCLYFLQWGKAGQLKSGLRSIPLLKNLLLAGAWSVTTVWFPCHILGWTDGTWYLFFSRYIFILVICFGVDLRDLLVDKKQNLRTLPVIFGYKKIQWLCIILLIVFDALIYLKPSSIIIPFRTGQHELILIISSLFTALSLLFLKKESSYNRFTILLDGNMFLQSLLLLLFL